jgi:N-acetylglucosaminyl-diphospho-decaprenol L-rhamnosyltransferase
VNAGPASPRGARIGVVTVSYGSAEIIDELLASLPTASAEPVETVVVDNKAPDPVAAEIAARHGARYVERPDNPGYGGAVNVGAATFGPGIEWILVVNPDVQLRPGAIDTLLARGESAPEIASVGPAIYQPDGAVYPSARPVPSIRTGVGHALFVNIWPENPWTARYRVRPDHLETADAGWLSGSCVLVRRSAFDAIGGFDDSYFMYFEDVDLGFRLGRAGFRNVYEPAAAAEHAGAHTTRDHRSAMIAAHHASARRFIGRKYPGPILAPVRLVLRIGLTLRGAVVARHAARESATAAH